MYNTQNTKGINTRKNMILIKGEIKTPDIVSCKYNANTHKTDVVFKNGKTYSYAYSNIEWLKEPRVLDPNLYHISRAGHEFFNIAAIYVFYGQAGAYWHICFEDGSERDYCGSELSINESCLNNVQSSNVFEYLKKIAKLSELRNEETGERLLAKKFEKVTFIDNTVALARYLSPSMKQKEHKGNYIPIFPFGCNNSQYKAVKNAMENQISVIQGPPGTGKTQTILNIIANILMQGKTVQVVSNNNSATENVYEKLSSTKYNLGFVVAALGNSENKKVFVEQQGRHYPDFSTWRLEAHPTELIQSISKQSIELKAIFDKQENLAQRRQELAHLVTELEYFKQYVDESAVDTEGLKLRKDLSSKCWMEMWQECKLLSETKRAVGIFFRIKAFLKYGMMNLSFYQQDIGKLITTFQAMYYRQKQSELTKEIGELEEELKSANSDLLNNFCEQSMRVLKDKLARKYEKNVTRKIFSEEDIWKEPYAVLEEYPVILSTTFSSRSSLNTDVVYDYLIMDEASQVDVATGALALSCAKNVVIVGDTKQLPNVVTEDIKAQSDAIFNSFCVNEGYRFTNSFLQSILDVMPNVAQTLLREHYRCHPKIINFCNQKFYRGELIVMTKDKGEKDVLSAIKTVQGNHERNHYSQRQIDVIKNEIIPQYTSSPDEIGIIAPYKNQVDALQKELPEIDAATVHKFQGKEKETIIISTVDDELSDFTDDPYLINVAVSRAKRRLILVTTGNEQAKERNITDLIDYIQYNNFEVKDSKIYSIFDYLYKQYTEERRIFLQKYKDVSEYDSEKLMFALLDQIIVDNKFACLDVVCHFPMNMLIRNPELLNEQECKYAMNPATHIDFLLFNRISKKPILAIEVDGYEYHAEGTEQAPRDVLKNRILELYEIPLLRFKTNGSGEKEKIVAMLEKLVN